MLCLNDMEFVLASRNKRKIAELETLLREEASKRKTADADGIKILSLDDVGYTAQIVEDGKTFEDNALLKARAAASTGHIGIADDSGLCVEALDGAPGIFSARYSGDYSTDSLNNSKLLRELDGITDRRAKFVCVIAMAYPEEENKQPVLVRGECKGSILTAPRGEDGFGYDPLFLPDGQGKTFGEMSDAEKNAISHRGRAIRLFAKLMFDNIRKFL